MIITRTPFRISIIGGGTDHPGWFKRHGGLVVGGAINRYAYLSVRRLPPFHGHKTRAVYSEIELVDRLGDLRHRAIRACLAHAGRPDDDRLEIFHQSDLPGRSGTGSSSAFVVGLLNALNALEGKRLSPRELACEAIEVERHAMGEAGGWQDQGFAAYGGLRLMRFHNGMEVYPLVLSERSLGSLERSLMLFFTGISRDSAAVAAACADALASRASQQAMMKLAEEGLRAVESGDVEKLGKLVDQSWRIKAGLADCVCPPAVSQMYASARELGAWGGKLTGAGGGGCLLLVAEPARQAAIAASLEGQGCVRVPFAFEHGGSQVVFAEK